MPLIQVSPGAQFDSESTRGHIPYVRPTDPKADILRNVLIVGGIEQSDGRLGDNDTQYLIHSLKLCYELGIPVSPQMDVHLSNIDYGHDFLKAAASADIVIFAYLLHAQGELLDMLTKIFKTMPKGHALLQSDKAFEEGVWSNALDQSDARIALNFTEFECRSELPTIKLTTGAFDAAAQRHVDVYGKHMCMDLLARRGYAIPANRAA